jgi:hypothetical protein
MTTLINSLAAFLVQDRSGSSIQPDSCLSQRIQKTAITTHFGIFEFRIWAYATPRKHCSAATSIVGGVVGRWELVGVVYVCGLTTTTQIILDLNWCTTSLTLAMQSVRASSEVAL